MPQFQRGFYLRPDLYVTADGDIFAPPASNGLSGINWEKVGNFFSPIVGGIADRIKGGSSGGGSVTPVPYTPLPPPPPSGFQMDTTTLLLIGGAVLLFMSKPGSGK